MYGAQTKDCTIKVVDWFENDVEMYGAQTNAFFTASDVPV